MEENVITASKSSQEQLKVKCVIWDLDNTLWHGILSEGDACCVSNSIRKVLDTFDSRGILQSVCSRNDYDHAFKQLQTLELDHYFLYPQINWGAKSIAIKEIVEELNIGMDTVAFIDDQPFERDEVLTGCEGIRVFDPSITQQCLGMDIFNPDHVSEDSKNRRVMMQSEMQRKSAQESFEGAEISFLRTLNMKLCIYPATHEDLIRASELTLRTSQLNTTGVTYGLNELEKHIADPARKVLMVELVDKYGEYGKIGLVMLDMSNPSFVFIDLLLMSCRVMSRGVGGVIINYLRRSCLEKGLGLKARFKSTDKNRMMYITYRFAGFKEAVNVNEEIPVLENVLQNIPKDPDYIEFKVSSKIGL